MLTAFSGPHVRAEVLEHVKDLPLPGRTIVVNLGTEPAYLVAEPRVPIPALSSTVAVNIYLERAEHVALLQLDETYPPAGIINETGWQHFTDIVGEDVFPRTTGLWRSPQADVGTVLLDPATLLEGTPPRSGPQPFQVRLMLWFAPAGTDCGLHNRHGFIETHAQIAGYGRMQKFTANDHGSLYEDLPMAPGYATPTPFCAAAPDGTFTYPWHQYRADTDCVWLAVEYHAVS
jgi:hypothetical protein